MNRFKAACRTNEPQATNVIMFTLLNCAAAGSSNRPGTLGLWLFAILFWPTVAFVCNLVDPITQPHKEPQ